jgi:hypothetical protein
LNETLPIERGVGRNPGWKGLGAVEATVTVPSDLAIPVGKYLCIARRGYSTIHTQRESEHFSAT